MEHPVLITSKGKIVKNDWAYRNLKTFRGILNAPLRPTKLIMDKETWDDILKWEVEDK